MNNLSKPNAIKTGSIAVDDRNYFSSLLEVSYTSGIIGERVFENIRNELIAVLADKCRKYTSNEMSSVRKELADELMKSITFTIGIYLKSFEDNEKAINELINIGVKKCLECGEKRLKQMVKSSRLFYEQLKNSAVNIDNEIYNSTLFGGLEGFFKLYDTEFFAHEINITADYRTMIYPIGYHGIEFIRRYMEYIYIENKICKRFDERKIKRLLAYYAVDYESTVRDMELNICSVVLANATACYIAGEDIFSLNVSENGKKKVSEYFSETGNGRTAVKSVLEIITDKEIIKNYVNKAESIAGIIKFICKE